MTSFVDQMNQLADRLVSEAEKRRQFVKNNKRNTLLLREKFSQDLQRKAAAKARELASSTNEMKRYVSRLIGDMHNRRVRMATEQHSKRSQAISRIRRGVASNLERNRTTRTRIAQQIARDLSRTMQENKRSVANMRSQSNRLTAAFASEIRNGRAALASARRRIAYANGELSS